MWLEERERLLQDIADRESLLGKADVHLSKEVDKLRYAKVTFLHA